MSEEAGRQFEKMSDKEMADLVGAISEFSSTHPWTTLSQIAGLQINANSAQEELSKRKPPVEITPNGEIISIDECLGRYKPKARRIVFFQRGIKAVAELLRRDTEDLGRVTEDVEHVVRYHEWAHAILHVGVDRDRHECELRDYNRIDERVHESLAQLLAWRAIEQNIRESRNGRVQTRWKRIQQVFTDLEARQPSKYRSWRRFERLSVPQLQKVLILIRRGTRFRDWEGMSALVQ